MSTEYTQLTTPSNVEPLLNPPQQPQQPQQPQLPARFSEKSFRRYERIIQTAVDLLPSRLVLEPRPDLSQETICARVRDAMRSLYDNRWSTTINMPKFVEHFDRIQVGREGVNVVIKLRSAPSALPVQATQTLVCSDCTDAVLRAIVLLRTKRIIPAILCTAVSPAQRTDILEPAESEGHIGLNVNEKGILIL